MNLYAPTAFRPQGEPINVSEESSVDYWTQALGCSEFDLRMAVAEVGPAVSDVSSQLGVAA